MVIPFMRQQVFGQDLNFLFIYFTTMKHEVHEQTEKGGKRCVVLDRDATFRFLGPFVDIYRVARSGVEKRKDGMPNTSRQ